MNNQEILDILTFVPMPGESINIVEAGIISDILEEDFILKIKVELPQKYEAFEQAIVTTMQDVLKRKLIYEGKVKIHVTIQKANRSNEPGGVSKVEHIIAIASGKGGVGKSTTSANLAISLSQLGLQVGILDADVFGPSIPKLFGIEKEIPKSIFIEDTEFTIPIEKYGIKLLSIGHFVKPEDAVAWRGPIAGKFLQQLINNVDWGKLDVLILDLPPGTSDIHITITETIELSGAVLVSTPQDIALIDVNRGIDFFQKKNIEVPILGIIENMAWFTPEELPNNKYYIFGEGGAKKLAEEKHLQYLGEIPLIQNIRENADLGQPITLNTNNISSKYFNQIALKLYETLENLRFLN